MAKRWNKLYQDIAAGTVAELCRRCGVSETVGLLLAVRGVTRDDAQSFLSGGMRALCDPFLLTDMDKAVARIARAMDAGERITVYGDYDVDGIASVAMLVSYFRAAGAKCDFYIPDRMSEGYGVNAAALEDIMRRGTTLLITVDTGITAIRETALAQSRGMDVIITDHHSVGETLPAACAVINPKRRGSVYPCKELAGAGVAFKLLCALDGNTAKIVTNYCDIAALATIADVVPLQGENRILTGLGLRKIRKMPSVGLAALFSVSGVAPDTVTSMHVGFGAAPRLNAAGRMGDCRPAVELLLTQDTARAQEIAQELDAENARRKAVGEQIWQEAQEELAKRDTADRKVLVLHHPDWHHGVIGIIASKVMEQYYKPAILISTDGETGKGSGRSIPGLNLYEALTACDDLLLQYGGHALAAGLTVAMDKIEDLEAALCRYADSVLTVEDLIPAINIDAPLPQNASLEQLAEELRILEPFGAGNTPPVFAVEAARLTSVRTSRDGKHLFLKLSVDGEELQCVGFGYGALEANLRVGDVLDVAGELNMNTYGGKSTPQLIIRDIQSG